MTSTPQDVLNSLLHSFDNRKEFNEPYTYWLLDNCLPDDILEDVKHLPFKAPSLDGVSGTREAHNKTRTYFDVDNQANLPAVDAVSKALQDKSLTDKVASNFNTDLEGTYLRIEYAQDTDGFWLEPHSDLGVKSFTMLLYLSDGPGHEGLGTDIYDSEKKQVGRSPFKPNSAMVFIPSDITFHGFEPRPIEGVRKSVIINYVTDEWRAREQLAFPQSPIC